MTPGTPRHFAWQAWHKPHIHRRFAWQAWHNLTSTVVLRGRRGTHGTGWRAWTGLVARDAAALCVAGVAQPDIHLRFTWQAWHKLTSTFVSGGRWHWASEIGHLHAKMRSLRSWSRGRAQLRFSNAVQHRHDRFCFLHADFHHAVLVVLFWSN